MKTLVLSQITPKYLDMMAAHCDLVRAGACCDEPQLDAEALNKLIKDHDPTVIIADSTPLGRENLLHANSLKLLICTRGNPVNIDKEYLDERNITLTCTPARNANSVAEFTLGLIISCVRNIFQASRAIKNGLVSLEADPDSFPRNQEDTIWYHSDLKAIPYEKFRGRELSSITIGIVGMGAIGRLLARKAALLGMEVLAYDPYLPSEKKEDVDASFVDLESLSENSDVVSLHAKPSAESFHLVDYSFLKRMKKEACLVNTARGSLVNTEDLLRALREGQISCAALDVFEYEPLSVRDELLSFDTVLATPHISGASSDVSSHHSRMAWEAFHSFLLGEAPPNRL